MWNKSFPIKITKAGLLQTAVFNLFLVAALGLLLRSFPFLPSLPFQYKNLLHGHSHFAFGGWVMPVLIWMIFHYFPVVREKVSHRHWRNIIALALFSAYGMLATFPFQGYALASIIFSTISIIAGFYLALILWKTTQTEKEKTSIRFLRAGLFYLVLSSVGPFATAPLIAMGYAGTPLYHNAIYFYLHFQYNGWFTFAVLAVLYKMLEKKNTGANGPKVFLLFNLSCVPAYFLSTLWNHPGAVFYFIGGIAGFMQIAAIILLLKDFVKFKETNRFLRFLLSFAMTAFVVKNVLQVLSAFPFVADLAFDNRNFIIAYLHLVLLGFISVFSFAAIAKAHKHLFNPIFRTAICVFLLAFVTTEALLVAQASEGIFHFSIPHFTVVLFWLSALFPVSAFILFLHTVRYFKKVNRPLLSFENSYIQTPAQNQSELARR